MRLMSCLRLTVALFICPALRVHNGPGAAKALGLPGDWLRFGGQDAAEQPKSQSGDDRAGFFDPADARATREDRAAFLKAVASIQDHHRPPFFPAQLRNRPNLWTDLRFAAPAFIPGVLAGAIIRAVQALLYPMLLAGPELEKRLRPHVERLDGISNAPLAKRALRSAMRWLLAERGNEPDTTESPAHPLTDAQAACLAELGLRRGKRTPPSAGSAAQAASQPMFLQDTPATIRGVQADATQGAR